MIRTVYDSAGRWVWSGETHDVSTILAETGEGAVAVSGEHGPDTIWTGDAVAPAPPPLPDPAEVLAAAARAVSAHIERQARALGYDSAASLASYTSSTVTAWQAEAEAFVAWRDAVWIAAHEAQDQPLDDILDALPPWPGEATEA